MLTLLMDIALSLIFAVGVYTLTFCIHALFVGEPRRRDQSGFPL